MAKKDTFPAIPAIAIILFLVVMAGFIPTIYGESQGNETSTLELTEGETTIVKPPIETTLSEVTNDQINVTIFDSRTGDTATTGLINVSETSTHQLSGETISVTYSADIGNNNAVVTYEYATTYGWGEIEIAIMSATGGIILILFIYGITRIVEFGGDN